jgi:hypothetical protein
MPRMMPGILSGRFLLPCFLLSWALPIMLAALPARAMAENLAGFSVMLQLGDSSDPKAMEIAPDGRWFLAASGTAIYLSDLKTGVVLRRLDAPGPLTRIAIGKDGTAVFARYSLPDGAETETLLGWNAETGRPIANSASEAPAAEGTNWSWINGKWPTGPAPPYDAHAPRKYLDDWNISNLVDVDRVERVEPTNHPDIVQVTVAGEKFDGDEAFAAYRYFFIDVRQRRILVELAGRTLNTFCGQPHGVFAFDGRHLVVAPTELGASSAFINSVMIDTEAKPPAVKWARPCQDFQVAGIAMQDGLIVTGPSPDKIRVWDPATARRLVALDDIHDSDVLAWSKDLTTFATGFHETTNSKPEQKFGVSLRRSGKKRFIPTGEPVQEIRFDPKGRKVFARMQGHWWAWDTSDGKSLPPDPLPPAGEGWPPWQNRPVPSPDGKFRIDKGRQLVEVATGRILVTARNLSVSDNWKYAWASSDPRSIDVWDVATGQKLWTATGNDTNEKDFLVMTFPDGRVRLSRGAERLVRLVRGYEVRPFDAAARRAFVRR